MREARRKLPQRSQPVPLLFDASCFSNSVGQESYEARSQFRHFLYELGEHEAGKFRIRPSVSARKVTRNVSSEKREDPRNVAGLSPDTRPCRRPRHRAIQTGLENTNIALSGITWTECRSPLPPHEVLANWLRNHSS